MLVSNGKFLKDVKCQPVRASEYYKNREPFKYMQSELVSIIRKLMVEEEPHEEQEKFEDHIVII